MTISGTRESFCLTLMSLLGFPGGSVVKKKQKQKQKKTTCQCRRHWFNPLIGKIPWKRTTHSSFLAWKIPRTEEPGGLLSMGSQRVRHYCAYPHIQCPFWEPVRRSSSPSQEMSAASWHSKPGHTLASSSATVTLALGPFQQLEVFSSYLSASW